MQVVYHNLPGTHRAAKIALDSIWYTGRMDHEQHMDSAHEHQHEELSANKVAVQATLHCLTGCAAGEIFGMVLATAFGWGNTTTIIVSIFFAFLFGYGLTIRSLIGHLSLRQALRVAFAADTFSIATMELMDSLTVILIPGALNAGLDDPLFWGSLAVALVVAFLAAVPVNKWLIARGQGHAVVHQYHHH